MSLMLPSAPPSDARLTDVLPSCYASLGVEDLPNRLGLPEASAVVLVLVDGLGLLNLSDSLGHAPFLRSRMGSVKRMTTVFPSTTAVALASLVTGELPGTHGILGYRIRNPRTGNIINQLSGLTDVADLDSWLGVPTLHEHARSSGKRSTVVGLPRFEKSPLTRVVHAGARYVGANGLAERVERVCDELADGIDFVLLYIPELDQVAHAQGVTSMAWLAALEEVDGALRTLVAAVPGGVRVYLTADHGYSMCPPRVILMWPRPRGISRAPRWWAGNRVPSRSFLTKASRERRERKSHWPTAIEKRGWRSSLTMPGWWCPRTSSPQDCGVP